MEGFLGRLPGRSHDGFVIIQRDGIEQQLIDPGIGSSEHGFGTTGTLGKSQVDNRGPRRRECFGDIRNE